MSRHVSALALFSAAALVAPATPATADVAASDVWANQVAMLRALGGRMSATLESDGTTTNVRGIDASFALPMGVGTANLTTSDIVLIENGDGTVTMRYPAAMDIAMGFSIAEFGDGSLAMRMTGPGYDMLASGDPGDVSYSYDVAEIAIELVGLDLSGPGFSPADMQALADANLAGTIRTAGNRGTMRIREGDLVTMSFDGTVDSQDFDFAYTTPDGLASTQSGSTGEVGFAAEVAIPANGVGLMALPQALRDGLSLSLQSRVADNVSNQEVKLGDQLFSSSRTVTALTDATVAADADGLRIDGTAEGYSLEMQNPMLVPLPVRLAASRISAAMEMPLLASDKPQPFVFRIGFGGLVIDESLWGLVDPAGVLPRDPADANLDLSGRIGTSVDLVDFEKLAELEATGEVPFSIHALDIADLLLRAVGAELTGSGAFTFDMNDLATFGGMPAPTGKLDLRLVGGNALLDKLVAMGLIPEDEAMGARMMMGLFARPGDGEDTLETTIEVDGATGAVSANGQRLQ